MDSTTTIQKTKNSLFITKHMNQSSETHDSVMRIIFLASVILLLIALLVYIVKKYLRSIPSSESDEQVNDKSQIEDTNNMSISTNMDIVSVGPNESQNLPQQKIDSKLKKQLMNDFDRHFRKIRFKANNEKFNQTSCEICKEEFAWYEWIRQLRPCKDLFHEVCIINHLETVSRNCPICYVDLNWEFQDQNKDRFSDEGKSTQSENNMNEKLDITGCFISPRAFAKEIVFSMNEDKQSPSDEIEVKPISQRTMQKIDLEYIRKKVRSKKKETADMKKKISDDLDSYNKKVIQVHTGSSEKNIMQNVQQTNLEKQNDEKEIKSFDLDSKAQDEIEDTLGDSVVKQIKA